MKSSLPRYSVGLKPENARKSRILYLALHSYRESGVSNRRLPLTSRRLDNDRQPVCANGVAMSRSAAANTGQLKAVGST